MRDPDTFFYDWWNDNSNAPPFAIPSCLDRKDYSNIEMRDKVYKSLLKAVFINGYCAGHKEANRLNSLRLRKLRSP